jgi:hypothetical protein
MAVEKEPRGDPAFAAENAASAAVSSRVIADEERDLAASAENQTEGRIAGRHGSSSGVDLGNGMAADRHDLVVLEDPFPEPKALVEAEKACRGDAAKPEKLKEALAAVIAEAAEEAHAPLGVAIEGHLQVLSGFDQDATGRVFDPEWMSIGESHD